MQLQIVNLNRDVMPDYTELIDNVALPYGREAVREVLSYTSRCISAQYWGATTPSFPREAFTIYNRLKAGLPEEIAVVEEVVETVEVLVEEWENPGAGDDLDDTFDF